MDFTRAWPWLQWVLASAAVIAFLVGAIRGIPTVWEFLKRFVKTVDSLAALPEELVEQAKFRATTDATLAKQDAQLDTLLHEVFPNSGASLRDAVDGQGKQLTDIQEKLSNDNTRIIELQKRGSDGRFKKDEQ